MGNNNYFDTKCKRCGLPIRMVQNTETRRWTPCEPTYTYFEEDPTCQETFVDVTDGTIKHGLPSDKDYDFVVAGYFKHSRGCEK